jgi:hypothetical protein
MKKVEDFVYHGNDSISELCDHVVFDREHLHLRQCWRRAHYAISGGKTIYLFCGPHYHKIMKELKDE